MIHKTSGIESSSSPQMDKPSACYGFASHLRWVFTDFPPRSSGLLPVQSVAHFGWTNLQWVRFFSQYFGFFVSSIPPTPHSDLHKKSESSAINVLA
jgi:hypothetical protein